MPRSDNEKMLGANFPSDFVESFWEKAAPEGTAKGLVVKAMALLWLDTPEDVRRTLLYPTKQDKPFFKLIREIVKDEIKISSAVIDLPEVQEPSPALHQKKTGHKHA